MNHEDSHWVRAYSDFVAEMTSLIQSYSLYGKLVAAAVQDVGLISPLDAVEKPLAASI